MKNKIAGALFGMALGDAMGMPDATDIAADHIKESYIEILKKRSISSMKLGVIAFKNAVVLIFKLL